MKLKKVLAILLTTATVMSLSVGNVVLAADVNPQTEVQQVENTAGSTSEGEQTQKEDQKTETGENEKGDQKTSEEETAEETQKESAAENREQKKQDAQEETVQEPKSEEIETQASGTIYLNPLSGSDSKTGTTSANAVKTLDKAKQLVTAGGTIYITGRSLNIASDTTISGNFTIKRDSSLSASTSMIMVENGATLTLENVTLDGASNGPLVNAQHANIVINAGTKLCNSQTAAIRITGGTLTMNGGEIYNNRGKYASDCGAVEVGRLVGAATFVMNGGKIYNNTSGGESAPGAIHVDKDCSFTMKGGEIYGNSTNGMGGAIDSAGTVTIEAGNIYSNSAANGGAIHTFDAGKTIIAGGTIRANSATNGGGAFNVNENATLEISDGTITANTAAWGGAINAYNHATIKLYGTGSITKNVSEKNAGALCLEGGVDPADGKGSSFVMTGGSITENVAGNGGDFGAGGAIVGYVWQGPVDIQILGGTISGNTAMDEGAGIVLRGDAGVGVATLKLGGSPKITDEVFLGDLTNFPDTKAEVISAFTPVNPVPITDSGWLDNRVVVSYAKGLAANVNDFTPADGNDNSAIIQDGLNLKSINKVLVSFVEKGYIADGNHTKYKSVLLLPNEKISKAEIPTVGNKPGYKVIGWKNSDTDTDWNFDQDVVTGSLHLYPVFQLEPAAFELKADKDHLHGEDGDKITLTTEFTAHGANNISYEWQWYKDGTLVKDGKNVDSLEVTEPGTYKVIVIADDGNLHSDSVEKTITITKTNHVYGAGWESDATQHWKTCKECQKKADVAAHIFGDWTVETQQTRAAETVKVRSCQVCGYEERVTVPAQPGEEKNISVSYEFTSKTKDAELPSEVLALLPKDTNSYAKGDAVKAIQPEKTTVKVTNGTWKFEGYDADEKEAVTGLTFTGSWTFTKDQTTDDDKKPENPSKPENPTNPDKGNGNANGGSKGDGNQNNGQNATNVSGAKANVKANTAAKTGDFSQTGVYMVLTLLSGLLLAVFAGRTWRRKNR